MGMRRLLLWATVWLSLVAFAHERDAVAQPVAGETTAFHQVVEMRVHVTHAPIYAAPRRNAEVVHTLAWNERLLVLGQAGTFYKVVHPEDGPQGYVLGTQLRPTSHPLHQSEMPADLRRQERYVGARFDLQGGIAIPYAAPSFADGYSPGLDVGARFSYLVAGPVGITARMSYRQFGQRDAARSLRPGNIDIQGRALSILTGAVGLDLTAFRGHLVAFVATVDGGVYHLAAHETVSAVHNPFGAASAVAWGGGASVRLSLRVGAAVRFFLEPSYEVIRAPAGDVHLVPARIGFSLER